jgi:hypothetical protein
MDLTKIEARVTLARGHLYKYKSLARESFEHVCEIIRDSRIFFPRPSQLNDPQECKPKSTIGDITDPNYWPAVEAWVRRCVAHRIPPPNEAEIQEELKQLTQKKLNALLDDVDSEYQAAVEDRYRILSFADSPSSAHLWNEYANNFTGVCLKFSVNSKFGTAYRVNYIDGQRVLDLTSVEEYEHLVLTGLLKRRKWRQEREYRLIFGDPPIDDQPQLVNQKYAFPSAHLTAVIFGHRTKLKQRAILIALAHNRKNRLRTFFATCQPSRRAILIRPYTIWTKYRSKIEEK